MNTDHRDNLLTVTPAGAISAYGATTAPSGWVICDGAAYSRTVIYNVLFGVIGTTFGVGDGSTTFNVPDLRGRMAAGYTASGGHADVATLGNADGTALANRRPKHKHTVTDPGHTHTVSVHENGNVGGTFIRETDNATQLSTPSTSSATTGISVGTSTDNPDAPPYLVVNYIIKY